MNTKEIRISHSRIQDSQTITQVQREEFKKRGLDMGVHEVKELSDDFQRKERVLTVKGPVKYYFQGKRRLTRKT